MSEPPKPKTAFLMKLQPIKPMDRYKHPMQYSFEQKNPKTSEVKVHLPPIDFSNNPEIPVFMAPYEQYASQKNPDFFREIFERRLDRGNEEELRQLFMPKPPRKSRYCGVCTEYYEEYYTHVTSESHKAKFTKHPFLQQIYSEMEKVHGDFLQEREKYITHPPSSPDDSPTFSTNRKREYLDSSRAQRIKNSEYGGKGNYSFKDDGDEPYTKCNSETRTTRKELYQVQKTTRKNDSKISFFESRTQLSENHDIVNKENEGGIVISNNVRHSEDLFDDHLGIIKKDETKSEPPQNPIQRVFMKLKYDKKDDNQENERPNFFAFQRFDSRTYGNPENDLGIFPCTSWIPHNLEESKSCTTTQTFAKVEAKDYEARFARRNPEKSLKRDHSKVSTSSEDDFISCFKKVKITDSQTQSQTAESETVKLEFNSVPREKWKNLKSSVVGLFGDFKGTVSKIYDFWKKKDS